MKKLSGRMNRTLNGLGTTVLDDYGMPLELGDTSIPAASPVNYGDYVPDFPTVADAPGTSIYNAPTVSAQPSITDDLSKIGSLVRFGADIYRFVAQADPSGRTLAMPVRQSNSAGSGVALANLAKSPLTWIGLYFFLKG